MAGLSEGWYPGLGGAAAPYANRWRSFLDDLQRSGVVIDPQQSGGYNPRNIRGTNTPSQHAFGRAYDVNWTANPEGSRADLAESARRALNLDMGGSVTPSPVIYPDIARTVAARHGMRWGGDFQGRSPDPMHFEMLPGSMPAPPVAERSMTQFAGLGGPSQAFLPAAGKAPAPVQRMATNVPTLMQEAGEMPPEPSQPLPTVEQMFSAPFGAGMPIPAPAAKPAPQAQPAPQVPPFETTTAAAPIDADAIVRGAQQAQIANNPPQPNFLERLSTNPMFLAGLSILGTPPGGAWGPAGAQALAAGTRSQRERSEYERRQRQQSVMDRVWAEAFPGGQPNMQHPLLTGQSPQVAAMIGALGPETALPLLARTAMQKGQLELKDIGGQGVVFDPRTGQVMQVPGTGPKPPEAIRTQAIKADQAYRNITTALDDYEKLVQRGGAVTNPGQYADSVQQARTNILLQLKELYNLGVLNGPDMTLMEQMLIDPGIGIMSGAPNLIPGNAAARVSAGSRRLREMLRTIRNNAVGAIGGAPQQAPAPSGRDPLGIR